jgi:hypothetical protein
LALGSRQCCLEFGSGCPVRELGGFSWPAPARLAPSRPLERVGRSLLGLGCSCRTRLFLLSRSSESAVLRQLARTTTVSDNSIRTKKKRKARAVQLSETRWMSAHTLEIERQQKRAIIKRRLGGQATRSMLWFSGEWSRALLSLPFEIWRCGNDARRHQQRRGRQGSRSVRAGAAGVAGATTAPLSPIRPPQAPSGSDHGLSEAYQQPGTRGAPHTAAAI